jgi:hypothetical protein
MEVGTARSIGKEILLNVRAHRNCEEVVKGQYQQLKTFGFKLLVAV